MATDYKTSWRQEWKAIYANFYGKFGVQQPPFNFIQSSRTNERDKKVLTDLGFLVSVAPLLPFSPSAGRLFSDIFCDIW